MHYVDIMLLIYDDMYDRTIMSLEEEIGKWVVCFGMLGRCSVYGQVISNGPKHVDIDDKVGGWDSNCWNRDYIKFFETENEAKTYYNENSY